MNKLKSKFVCNSVLKTTNAESVSLNAVVSGSEENASFSLATPHGELKMTITNPSAFGFFTAGKEYYLDFTVAS